MSFYYRNITSEVKIIALISPTLTSVSHVSLVPGEKLEVSTNLDLYVPHILGKFDSNNVDISNTVVARRLVNEEAKHAKKSEEGKEKTKTATVEVEKKEPTDRPTTKAKGPSTKLKNKRTPKVKLIKERKPRKTAPIKKASKEGEV